MGLFDKKYKVEELSFGEVYKVNTDSGETEHCWVTVIKTSDFDKEKYTDVFGRRLYNEGAKKTPGVYHYLDGCYPLHHEKKYLTRDELIHIVADMDHHHDHHHHDEQPNPFGVKKGMKNLNEQN